MSNLTRMMPTQTAGIVTAAVCLSICLAGCGEHDWHAKLHPVSGSVTINGKPAEGVLVQLLFIGQAPDRRESIPWGFVNADGTYELSTYDYLDGCPSGDYAVTLAWLQNPHYPPSGDRLRGAYISRETALLNVTIKPGKNQIPPIVLEGIKVLPPLKKAAPDPAEMPPAPL